MTTSRALLVVTLTLGLLAASLAAEAQSAGKVRRIGYLSGASAFGPREEAFRQGLRDLAHVEGQNIVIEWRFTEGREDRLATLALELVRSKVDVIVTDGTRGTGAIKNATPCVRP